MNIKLVELKEFLSKHYLTIAFLAFILFYAGFTLASTTGGGGSGNDAAFENGYNWVMSVIKGKLGVLLAAVAFIIGLVWGIVKQAPMAVVGGIIFALLIAFGVDMATGIVNSSLVMNEVANNNPLLASLISFAIVLSAWLAISAKNNYTDYQISRNMQMIDAK